MTDKVLLEDIDTFTSDTSAVATYDFNNQQIVTGINNSLSLIGAAPNSMEANLDMNSNRLLNLPAAVSTLEPLRLIDLMDFTGNASLAFNNLPVGGTTGQFLEKNSNANYDFSWNTVNYLPAYSVKQFGATGNGFTDDTAAIQSAINTVFVQQTSLNGGSGNLGILFFPSGSYKISSALTINGCVGGYILGAGASSTFITNQNAGGCFAINGMAFTIIEGIYFQTVDATATLVDLDWDGTHFVSTQSNTFRRCVFQSGNVGIGMGYSGFQVSENSVLDCNFFNQTFAGLYVTNFNALQQTVIGGDFNNCLYGIYVQSGSVPIISGVGFQRSGQGVANAGWDISINNSSSDTYSISGCRTESQNFLQNLWGHCTVTACEHGTNSSVYGTNVGSFVTIEFHDAVLIGCTSRSEIGGVPGGGTINFNGGVATIPSFTLIGCEFSNPNFAGNNAQGTAINTWYNYTGDTPLTTGTFINDNYFIGNGSSVNIAGITDNINYYIQAPISRRISSTAGALNQIFSQSGASSGQLTLPAGQYFFEGLLYFTGLSVTHLGNATIDILGAGTAVLSNVLWWADGAQQNTGLPAAAGNGTTSLFVSNTSAGNVVIPSGTANANLFVRIAGNLTVGTAGTIIPSVAVSETGGTPFTNAGSYFHLTNTLAAVNGPWS